MEEIFKHPKEMFQHRVRSSSESQCGQNSTDHRNMDHSSYFNSLTLAGDVKHGKHITSTPLSQKATFRVDSQERGFSDITTPFSDIKAALPQLSKIHDSGFSEIVTPSMSDALLKPHISDTCHELPIPIKKLDLEFQSQGSDSAFEDSCYVSQLSNFVDSQSSISQSELPPVTEKLKSSEHEMICESNLHTCKLSLQTCESSLPTCEPNSQQTGFSARLNNLIKSVMPVHPDRLIGRKMGLDFVDIIAELEVRNMSLPLDLVFSYLDGKDVNSLSLVSDIYRRICSTSTVGNEKRRRYLKQKRRTKSEKENMCHKKPAGRGLTESRTTLGPVQPTSPLKRSQSVLAVQNNLSKHVNFVQVAESLKNDESLRKCPKCCNPARTHERMERAICTNNLCNFTFCTRCKNEFHGSRDCSISVSPKKAKTEKIGVGTKKSKKNLRRL